MLYFECLSLLLLFEAVCYNSIHISRHSINDFIIRQPVLRESKILNINQTKLNWNPLEISVLLLKPLSFNTPAVKTISVCMF